MRGRLAACAVFLCVVVGVSACGGNGVSGAGAAATTSPTHAATPTVGSAPTAGPPTPTNVPVGWQVYAGPHFTIAYPSGWTASAFPQANSTPARPNVTYALTAPGGGSSGSVSVNEQDGWDDASIQSDFCPPDPQMVTLAGLQMQYQTGAGGAGRAWLFVTNTGTVYSLATADGYASPGVQTLDNAVLATFRPEYVTPGCK
jgi:hypothetical protein